MKYVSIKVASQCRTRSDNITVRRIPAHAPHDMHVDARPSEYAPAGHGKQADEPAGLNIMGGHTTAEATSVSPVALHEVPAGQGICDEADGQYDPSAHVVALTLPIGQYVPIEQAYCVGVDEPAPQ